MIPKNPQFSEDCAPRRLVEIVSRPVSLFSTLLQVIRPRIADATTFSILDQTLCICVLSNRYKIPRHQLNAQLHIIMASFVNV